MSCVYLAGPITSLAYLLVSSLICWTSSEVKKSLNISRGVSGTGTVGPIGDGGTKGWMKGTVRVLVHGVCMELVRTGKGVRGVAEGEDGGKAVVAGGGATDVRVGVKGRGVTGEVLQPRIGVTSGRSVSSGSRLLAIGIGSGCTLRMRGCHESSCASLVLS